MNIARPVNDALRRVPPWAIYIVAPVPAIWYFWLGLTGGLGAEPIKALEHALGLFALKLLVAVLAITPLRRFAGINLVRFRRAVGVVAFFYVALHLSAWLFLDIRDPARIWADILKRPYITVGMAGFVLLLPLALTSNDWSVRRMGPGWRRLHRLTYPAVLLGGVHYLMLVKGWQMAPLVYLAAILALLGLRWRWRRRRAMA